jgi:hydroxyacylglutathione hydrolase
MVQIEDEWFDIIAKARSGQGASLAKIAEAVGVSFEVLESWEGGTGTPNADQLASLSRALQLDAGKLSAVQRGQGRPNALTHCHQDHMEGASLIKTQTGALVATPKAECATYREHHREAPDLAVEDGTTIAVSPTISLTAIATPGHTAGGTCYLIGNVCAVGDALFAASMGRAMSPAGYRSLRTSISTRILSLPGATILLPGHGPMTTVADELRNNPFFPI